MPATIHDASYALLKTSLGLYLPGPDIEKVLLVKLDQAAGQLQRAGLTLDAKDPADASLLAAYAEWLYNRRTDMALKPRSLIEEIHSRQIAKATASAKPPAPEPDDGADVYVIDDEEVEM